MAQLFSKKTLFIVAALIVVGVIFFVIFPIAIPLVIAFVTAVVLEPLVRLIHQKTKLNRNLAVLIVFLLFLAVMLLTGYLITTKVVSEVIKFVERIPTYIYTINDVWHSRAQ